MKAQCSEFRMIRGLIRGEAVKKPRQARRACLVAVPISAALPLAHWGTGFGEESKESITVE
jgi:hypothetical protein